MSLIEAAEFLSQQWPVFACKADKKPATAHGFKDATRDAYTLRKQFQQTDAALIGVPTGRRSDLFVVDVDLAGLEWLAANEHRMPATRRHRTRSGGVHLLFRYPADAELRNSASRIAPGVDTRAEGGYIISPPSEGYSIADDAMPAMPPEWLIEACLTRPAQVDAPSTYSAPSDRYAQAALDGEVLAVQRAGEGGRNHQLNVSAVKLGSLVAAGALSRATVENELTRAALAAGLDRAEIRATIASGLGFGMTQPRQVPERSQPLRIEAPRVMAADPKDSVAPNAQEPPLPIIWFHDAEPKLDAADFVEGLLIEGGMSVVYGESNCGKTFFATDLALHVATGRSWRGREVEPGGVLYCALEGSHGISNRVAAWKREQKLEGTEIPFAIVPVSLNLLDPEADPQRLIAAIRYVAAEAGFDVKMVVVDTLSRAMAGGNENASEDMGALVVNGDAIRQATGAHAMWIHHSGKDAAKGARGHSLLRAATDTEIEVSRVSKDAPSVARVVKQREMEIEGEFAFTLKSVELGQNRRGKPVTSCVVEVAEAPEAGSTGKAPGTRHFPPTAQIGMRALRNALSRSGAVLPPTSDYPRNTSGVSHAEWRNEFYQLQGDAKQDTKKKAFQLAERWLVANTVITARNGLVWFVKTENETGK